MLTVKTPAESFDLISLNTARVVIEGADDGVLKPLIARASDVVTRHCRRVFAIETVEEQFRPDRYQGELMLSRYPVVEIVSISENGTALSATDYELENARGFLTRLSNDRPCYWPAQKIIVTYKAGFDLPTRTPEALQQAAIQLVRAYYHARGRDPALRSEDVPGIMNATYLDIEHLPHDVRGLLTPFRDMRVR